MPPTVTYYHRSDPPSIEIVTGRAGRHRAKRLPICGCATEGFRVVSMVDARMGKRLQVVLDDADFEELTDLAAREGMTRSEWVRQVLARARRERTVSDPSRKLEAIRAATRHAFPTGDVSEMLAEIAQGYSGFDGYGGTERVT